MSAVSRITHRPSVSRITHRRPRRRPPIINPERVSLPARYGVELLVPPGPHAFPWATFLTNASGSLLLGVLLVLIHDRWPPSRYARPFLATGFLGAYTTFSSYVLQVDLLAKDGHPGTATAYAAASLLAGLLLAWLGISVGRRLAGP